MRILHHIAYASFALTAIPASAQPVTDPCLKPVWNTPGPISWLNSKVGKPDGPPALVDSIKDVTPYRFMNHGASVSCHATILMQDGWSESGVFRFIDRHEPTTGKELPLDVTWMSDAALAAEARAKAEREQAEGKIAQFHAFRACWEAMVTSIQAGTPDASADEISSRVSAICSRLLPR